VNADHLWRYHAEGSWQAPRSRTKFADIPRARTQSSPIDLSWSLLRASPKANGQTAAELIARHVAGDFGDVSESDAEANRQNIAIGTGRVLSAYTLADGATRLWVITNIVDGRARDTCVLRPGEY
jgi:hypothetical protein